jgi:hypothetical protein
MCAFRPYVIGGLAARSCTTFEDNPRSMIRKTRKACQVKDLICLDEVGDGPSHLVAGV